MKFYSSPWSKSARQLNVFYLLTTLCIASIILAGCAEVDAEPDEYTNPDIQYIQPNDELGASLATIADDVPLAHTASLLALDQDSSIVGATDVDAQVDKILDNLSRVLEEVNSGLDALLKLNIYVTDNSVANQVREHLSDRFSGPSKPAVAFSVSRLPHSEALVSMDGVAVAPEIEGHDRRIIRHVSGIAGAGDQSRGHVAIMPPGGKVYLSGQVAEGEPEEAMRESLESLHDRLAYLGLSNDDVVQLKLFVDDIADAQDLEEKMAEYYRHKPAPPIITSEWTHPGVDIEVELIATRGMPPYDDEEHITYPTPAGLQTFPQYSRAAEIHRGRIIYLSGLYGDIERDGEGQIEDIFDQMGGILDEAGTDFEHLAKATYFLEGWDADVRVPLGSIRSEVFNPDRPPTSSLIPVASVGKDGALVTIDMIGVIPE